jgi:purine-binding chemotaxis protein CheW
MNQEQKEQILRERAKLLARTLGDGAVAEERVEVVVCTVGAETFALPVQHLREIVPLPPLTRLPYAPSFCLGLVQVRGSLICAVDLAQFCNVNGTSDLAHVAVVEGPSGALGLCIDRVLGCQSIVLSSLQSGGEHAERRAAIGVTPDLVVVLDIPRLVSLPEMILQ